MSKIRIKISSSEDEYSSLHEVFKSTGVKNSTIYILTDVTLEEPVVIDKSCDIDLGGHYIFVPMTAGITVKGAASVKFYNGYIQTLSSEPVEDSLISQGSKTTITLCDSLQIDTSGTAVHARKRGKVIIDGASIKSIGSQPAVVVDDSLSTAVMQNGSVASYSSTAIAIHCGGSVVIEDGEVFTTSNGLIPENTYPAIIANGQDSSLTVNNGSIFSDKTVAISAQNGASVEINGGHIYTKNDNWPAVELQDGLTSYLQTGGHVESTRSYAFVANETEVGSVQKLAVTGGKVGAYKDVVLTADHGDHGIVFSGGYVKGTLQPQYLAPGHVVSDIKDENGYAEIIVRTWHQSEVDEPDVLGVDPSGEKPDIDLVFPDETSDTSIDMNPYGHLPKLAPNIVRTLPFAQEIPDNLPQDPSMVQYVPFPPEPVKSDGTNPYVAPSNTILHTTDSPNINFDEHLPTSVEVPEFDYPHQVIDSSDTQDTAVKDCSINVKNTIHIYRDIMKKKIITEWRGALRILEGKYTNPQGDEFAAVRFKMSGSGQYVSGYVLVQDIAMYL